MNRSNWIGRVGEQIAMDRIAISRLGAGGSIIDHRDDPNYPDVEVEKPNIFTGAWETEFYEIKSTGEK